MNNGASLLPETMKMWLVPTTSDVQNGSVGLSAVHRSQTTMTTVCNNPNIMNAINTSNLPFFNGSPRIKSEPIEIEEHHRKILDGNDQMVTRMDHPAKSFRLTPPGRRQREAMGGLGDTSGASNVCQICGKWFRSRQQVAQHLLVHTDERRYKCSYCDRAFKQASHLQQHHRIHTGEKPYRCPLPGCSRAFPQLSNLNHHLRNHDKPDPPPSNTCVYCKRVYASETVLRTHIERIHLDKGVVESTPEITSDPDKPKTYPNKTKYSNPVMRSNMIKFAPSSLPSMTAPPPVLNFSQSFLSPYVHELNFVRLPGTLPNFSQLPADSKMVLPISLPNGHHGPSHMNEISSNSREQERERDTTRSSSNESIAVAQLASEYVNIFSVAANSENRRSPKQALSLGVLERPLPDRNGSLEDQEKQLVNSNIKPINQDSHFEQNGMDLCDKSRAKSDQVQKAIRRQTSLNGSDDKTAESVDSVRDRYEMPKTGVDLCDDNDASEHKHPYGYRYTLDNAPRETTKTNLVSLQKHKDFNSDSDVESENGDAQAENPWASTDHIIRSRVRQLLGKNGDVIMQRDVIDDIRKSVGAGDFVDTVYGNSEDDGTHSPPEIRSNVENQFFLRRNSSEMIGAFPENGQSSISNFQEFQSHSRKRKAFRPQRVIHEKVFVQEADL